MDEAEAFKLRIREQYDEMAERWHRWTPVMSAQYAPATELMLVLARLRPGDRVLDIAAGDGYQSVAAARRVGPTGNVLAVDIAREQLRYAAAAAREAGVKPVGARGAAPIPNTAITQACSLKGVLQSVGLATPHRGGRHVKQVL